MSITSEAEQHPHRQCVRAHSPTPHDGEDGVAFVIDDGRHRLGILTDLGHVFQDLGRTIASLDAVLLESNYDPEMLANGPYPASSSPHQRTGRHISNLEAAELLAGAAGDRLRWHACHLSEENNSPDLALRTHREVHGPAFPFASQAAMPYRRY